MKTNNDIRVFDSVSDLCKGTADFILNLATQAIKERGKFTISLSGGNTPKALYELMAQSPYREQMPWSQTYFFWGDERCVPENDPQNNACMTRKALLDKIEIPVNNIFPVRTNLAPDVAALAYEQTILDFFEQSFPAFDLILLGLGENGHTASLFPGTNVLTEEEKMVAELYVEEVKMYRITFTVPLINNSANVLFLVSGDSKAEVVNTVINTAYKESNLPAQLIRTVKGNTYWFLDKAAAGKLPVK